MKFGMVVTPQVNTPNLHSNMSLVVIPSEGMHKVAKLDHDATVSYDGVRLRTTQLTIPSLT
jgi:hypothetical protein